MMLRPILQLNKSFKKKEIYIFFKVIFKNGYISIFISSTDWVYWAFKKCSAKIAFSSWNKSISRIFFKYITYWSTLFPKCAALLITLLVIDWDWTELEIMGDEIIEFCWSCCWVWGGRSVFSEAFFAGSSLMDGISTKEDEDSSTVSPSNRLT